MKKYKPYLFLPFLFLAGVFISCKQNKPVEKLDKSLFQGAWNFDEHISYDELKQMPEFKEALGVISDAEMDIKGTNNFNSNGRYTMKGTVALKMKTADSGQEVTMRFEMRETGTWTLKDSVLTSVTEDGDVMAADDATQQITGEDPDMLNDIRPKKGEATVDEIKSFTATQIELLDTKTKLSTILKKQ